MLCPYRKLIIREEPPKKLSGNMAYLAREEEKYPECHGEAFPFYISEEVYISKAGDIGKKESCRRAEKEADG